LLRDTDEAGIDCREGLRDVEELIRMRLLKKSSGRAPKDGFQPFQQSHPEDFAGNRGVILEVVVEKSDRRSVFQHSQDTRGDHEIDP
jgi:hypothetical protein